MNIHVISKRWISCGKNAGRQKQGECDFIVVHPSKGILFIEAKSGRIFFCAGVEDYWYCEDTKKPFRNPLHQVVKSQYEIIGYLRSKLNGEYGLPYSHAISFPQATNIADTLPGDLVREMIILKPDLAGLQENIDIALSVFKKPLKYHIKEEAFNKILSLLKAEFHITSSLCDRLEDLNNQFFQLEKEQISLLDNINENRRILIEGCAGSGKTLIAMEKAKKESLAGRRVLILTYNIPLADRIRESINTFTQSIDVYHFHGLCEHAVTSIGNKFEIDQADLSRFYDAQCPEMLMEAIPYFQKRYDCIIVDEAQDFFEEWWKPVIELLDDPNNSQLYIFRDMNQNIFSRSGIIPIDNMATFKIKNNYRNTPAISKWINKVCGTEMIPTDKVEEGIEPEIIKVRRNDNEIDIVDKVISNLIKKEKLKAQQILILGRNRLSKSVFASSAQMAGFKLIEDQIGENGNDCIRYSSIYRFKGLEAECVILTEIEGAGRNDIKENLKCVLYTAASRAKSLLYVLMKDK